MTKQRNECHPVFKILSMHQAAVIVLIIIIIRILLQELVASNPEPRNWRANIISVLVILFVILMVVVRLIFHFNEIICSQFAFKFKKYMQIWSPPEKAL